jgi:cardiolipin synthase
LDDRNNVNHPRSLLPRLDLAVNVEGPVVHSIEDTLRRVWERTQRRQHWRFGRWGAPLALKLPASIEPVQAALVVRDERRHRRAIETCHLHALAQAQHSIDLVTPYFYPGQSFRRALVRAAHRGVRVRLLLQGKPDYQLAGLAARVLYEELLAAGVEIYEYTAAFLHAKAARVDDEWATVGSSNIDPLSLLLNLEANVLIRNRAFSQSLCAVFETALAHAERVLTPPIRPGWPAWLGRAMVNWLARTYLRLAGLRQPY